MTDEVRARPPYHNCAAHAISCPIHNDRMHREEVCTCGPFPGKPSQGWGRMTLWTRILLALGLLNNEHNPSYIAPCSPRCCATQPWEYGHTYSSGPHGDCE